MKQIEELSAVHTYEEAPDSLLSPYMHTAINAVASRTPEGGGARMTRGRRVRNRGLVAAAKFVWHIEPLAQLQARSVRQCRL